MKKVLVLGAMLVGACVGQALADRDGEFREAARLAVATGSTVLAEGKIIVGGSDNVAAHKTPSGA